MPAAWRQYATADSGGGLNRTLAYNDANRMKQATAAGATTLYTYNALGQRAIKSPSGKNVPAAQKRHFHYGLDGQLLAESDGAGLGRIRSRSQHVFAHEGSARSF